MAAGYNFSTRAYEPSPMESDLAVLATKPETAGAALQLLPGAAAIRQQVGDYAAAAEQRANLLQMMQQRETSRHQLAEDTTNAIKLDKLGQLALARGAPGTGYLFGDNSDQLIQGITNRQSAADTAATQKTNMEAYDLGVKSGYRTPAQVAGAQLGYAPNMMAPEGEILQGMKDAAAAARQGVDAARAKLTTFEQVAKPGGQPGEMMWVAKTPAGGDYRAGELEAARMNESPLVKTTNADGTVTLTPGGYSPAVLGSQTGRKSGVPLGAVTFRPGSPTQAAGGALPPAPRDQSAAAPTVPVTPQAPTKQAPTASTMPLDKHAQNAPTAQEQRYVLEKYVRQHPEQPGLVEKLGNGRLSIGYDPKTGLKYITEDGVPKQALTYSGK